MNGQRFAGERMAATQAHGRRKDPLVAGTEILGGKYVVERTLGAGGMGVVVAARHKALGRRDAIKFLLPQFVTNRELLERFKREAQAAGNLESPHVAHVRDAGFTESGEPYIAMEYLEGRDLKTVLQEGPLPIDVTVEYLLQVCHALAEAHANRIVHRDLKPANLFLAVPKNGAPYVKVLDFGIAKMLDAEPVTEICTDEGKAGFLGTVPYMSPEHLRGAKTVDYRTDIWALGVIAYELLTCKKPFHASNKLDLVSKILSKEEHPAPPSLYRRDLPPAIEMVIGRCLAKDRDLRYQTVREFENALRQAAGIPAPPPMRASMPLISPSVALGVPAASEPTHVSMGVTNTPAFRGSGRALGKTLLAAGSVMTMAAMALALGMILQSAEDLGKASPGPAMSISTAAAVSVGPVISGTPTAQQAMTVVPNDNSKSKTEVRTHSAPPKTEAVRGVNQVVAEGKKSPQPAPTKPTTTTATRQGQTAKTPLPSATNASTDYLPDPYH